MTKLLDRWLNHVQRRTCLCRKMLGVNYIKTAMFANITFNNGHFSLIWRRAITRKRVIQNLFLWNWVIQYLLQTMHAKFDISRRKNLATLLCIVFLACFAPASPPRSPRSPNSSVLRSRIFFSLLAGSRFGGYRVFLTEAFISLDIQCVSLTFPLAYQYLAPQDIYMFSDLI